MTDEKYLFIQDIKDKKNVARSARNMRTHNGKRGAVKLPSDYMSRKEMKAMNGEVKTYRLNDPVSWDEFKEWPDEHKIMYVKGLREKFGVPNKEIAEMMGIHDITFNQHLKCWGITSGSEDIQNYRKEAFLAWRSGANSDLVKENVEVDLTTPMTWTEFKKLSNDQKIQYIKWIREMFGAPDCWIARMLGVTHKCISNCCTELGISIGKGVNNGKKKWKKEEFLSWCGSVDENRSVEPQEAVEAENDVGPVSEEVKVENEAPEVPEVTVDAVEDTPITEKSIEKRIKEVGPIAFAGNSIPVIPKSGTMTFEQNYVADILKTLDSLLNGAGVRVNLTVSWDCVFPER